MAAEAGAGEEAVTRLVRRGGVILQQRHLPVQVFSG
jgi:hypothetical protein